MTDKTKLFRSSDVQGTVIKRLPKIELHCHLDGSVRPGTLFDMAVEEGVEMPTGGPGKFREHVQVFSNCKSLNEYLLKFDIPLRVLQKPKHLYRAAAELLEDAADHNVKYIEVRFSPFFFMEGGMSFDEVVETVLKAKDEAETIYDVICNYILVCMRHDSPEKSIEVVERGKKYIGRGVVGIDLAGNEQDFPPDLHKEAFRRAKGYGFHRTVHAGETGIPGNVITAVEELYAERIGHGVHAYMDDEVINFIKEKQIPLEMCITSNVHTGAVANYERHPIKNYLKENIRVTVNTDNTTVSNTNQDMEFQILAEKQGFSIEDIKRVIMNGINASFASAEVKYKLHRMLEDALKKA